ncbi:uncharacterized protein LOC135942165 [Cloeon dipterum]|uniref:uncharacterized protein LOC135936192 n=1 Tax=Cloeon dipterum TaxID=197152 RepID=UPI00322034D8
MMRMLLKITIRRASFSLLGEIADERELFQTDRCCEVVEKDLRCCVSVAATQAEGEDIYFCRYRLEMNYAFKLPVDFVSGLKCSGGRAWWKIGNAKVVASGINGQPTVEYLGMMISRHTCVAVECEKQELLSIMRVEGIILPEGVKAGSSRSACKIRLRAAAFERDGNAKAENTLILTNCSRIVPLSRVQRVVQVFFAASRKEMMFTPTTSFTGVPSFSCCAVKEAESGRVQEIGHPAKYQIMAAISSGPRRPLRCLDLFAGCGGMSVGLEMSSLTRTLWAVDSNEIACSTFKRNFPQASVYCDYVEHWLQQVKRLGQGLPQQGEVEVIIGGPPCQGFSQCNRQKKSKRASMNISQTGIFMEVVKFLKPRFFIMENVKEIVTHDKGKHLREALKTALDHGYQARMMVLLADDFGVPQLRQRFFLVGALGNEELPDIPRRTHLSGRKCHKLQCGSCPLDFSTEEPAIFGPVTVRDAISDLKDLETTLGAKPYPLVQSAYQAKMRRGSDRVKLHRMVKPLSRVDQVRISKIKPGEDWSVLLTEPADQCGLQGTNLAPSMLSRTGPRNGWWKGAYGRLEWNKKFKTIIASQNLASKSGTLIHPQVDRTITLREIARAQSFPDNFVFRGTPRAIQRLIGNAVPPLLAECIGFSFQQ